MKVKKAASKGASAYIVRLTVTLFLFSAVTAFLLSFINGITKDRIEEMKTEATKKAMETVLPGDGVTYEEVPYTGGDVDAVSKALQNGKTIGYCVMVSPSGFGGEISMVVGIGTDNKVTGVQIISQAETAGLGSKAASGDFLGQYQGLKEHIKVVKGAAADNSISAITGATITSNAVTSGVNAAFDAVASLS